MKEKRKVYDEVMERLRAHPNVQRMKQFRQHGRISTYEHCEDVARTSWKLNRLLHLHADETTLLEGAMLHDYYLYDWHAKDGGTHDWHGFIHAGRAAENAERDFHVGKDVQHVIRSHMWPLNLTRVPRSREAWLVCIADKYVSLKETLAKR